MGHLLYMDDIKLYAKNERNIDSLIHLTGWMIAKRGKVIKTDGLELPAGHIADIETSYKYLGIPQSHGNHEEEAETVHHLERGWMGPNEHPSHRTG